MKFIEILKEILLALIIAILLPIIVYSGINLIYKIPNYRDYVEQNLDYNKKEDFELIKQQELLFNQANKPAKIIIFITSIIIGLILIITGYLIKINTFSLALIGGGILNIFMGLFNAPDSIIINFTTLILSLFILLFLSTKKQSKIK